MEMTTSDLYCASYILAEGGKLKAVRIIERNDAPYAEFVLTGDDVQSMEETYRSGRATACVVALRTNLHHVKDMMFHELRKYERNRARPRRYGL